MVKSVTQQFCLFPRYVGCYESSKEVEAEYTLLSDDDMNPSSCAAICAANSNGRDFSHFLIGYKEYVWLSLIHI